MAESQAATRAVARTERFENSDGTVDMLVEWKDGGRAVFRDVRRTASGVTAFSAIVADGPTLTAGSTTPRRS